MCSTRPTRVLLASLFMVLSSSVGSALTVDELGFMQGNDISALTTMENHGANYYDAQGNPADAVELFREAGLDWYRLRIFVDPNGQGQVTNDLQYTINLAQRIKAAGGRIYLDFHYSDTWADPGKQYIPSAWQGMSFSQIEQKVEDYTYEVLQAMREKDVLPEVVQIGNEVSSGMIWPEGEIYSSRWNQNEGFDRFAALLNAGINGTKRLSEDEQPLIMVHHNKGGSWGDIEYFYDRIEERHVDYDLIGLSFYPAYEGTMAGLQQTLNNAAAKYGKGLVIAEVGAANRDPQWESFTEYPINEQGQADFIADVGAMVRDLPNDLGKGVFWWHGEAVPTSSGVGWVGGRRGLFDENSRITDAAYALGAIVPESSGASWSEGRIDNGQPSDAVGQSLIVGLDASLSGTLDQGDPVSLDSIQFVSGGQRTGNTHTSLVLLEGIEHDWDNAIGLDDPRLLALSLETIDTTSLSFGDAMRFDFDTTLPYGELVTAVFATISNDLIHPISVSTAYMRFEQVSGVWVPAYAYGNDDSRVTSWFSDYDGDGVLTASENSSDLSFTANFAVDGDPSDSVLGDINGDTLIDTFDIRMLAQVIRDGDSSDRFDLDGSSSVDAADLTYLVEQLLDIPMGDANMDGKVDLLDLSILAGSFGSEAGWLGGNFDANPLVDLLDLSILAAHFGQTASGVPAPASLWIVLPLSLFVSGRRLSAAE